MKKFTVRAFVLTLALAGFAASNAATTNHKVASISDPSGPMPMCAPSSGQTCGLD